ncbi:hypothetical protein MA16_Dca026486 [Dendrobium catenatum]|uniref:Uncharacterized protein n=1 Tax=Dendrobium catenatum TaxID=906689 RepID=A0A2I0WJG1_9ASPA|nr:hypothetical protein MA16_Dca026486 [Dendrobium catenatum]
MAACCPILLSPPNHGRGRRHKALRGRLRRRAIRRSRQKRAGNNVEILQLVLFLYKGFDAFGGDSCSVCVGQRWMGMRIRDSDSGNGDLVDFVCGRVPDV